MVSMSSAGMYSKRPWKFSPPVHRFGQGRPSKDRRAPSVPPRMGTTFGVTPTEAKEMLYQAAAYLGIGRLYPFLRAANEILAERGVRLPLPGQSTTAAEERLAAGERAQIEIFGDGMKDFWRSGPEDSRHINRWLTDNCFGDWYTRGGLDLRRREMLTFCFLAAQGGCERQLASHIAANIRLGSGKEFLIKVISQCIPFIGYPRALNALDCINKISE